MKKLNKMKIRALISNFLENLQVNFLVQIDRSIDIEHTAINKTIVIIKRRRVKDTES